MSHSDQEVLRNQWSELIRRAAEEARSRDSSHSRKQPWTVAAEQIQSGNDGKCPASNTVRGWIEEGTVPHADFRDSACAFIGRYVRKEAREEATTLILALDTDNKTAARRGRSEQASRSSDELRQSPIPPRPDPRDRARRDFLHLLVNGEMPLLADLDLSAPHYQLGSALTDGQAPPYVRRRLQDTVEARLANAVQAPREGRHPWTRTVILHGAPKTGKTRLLLETLRELQPIDEWGSGNTRLIYPRRGKLREVAETTFHGAQWEREQYLWVVFVEDIHNELDQLTMQLLRELVAGNQPVVLTATLWTHELPARKPHIEALGFDPAVVMGIRDSWVGPLSVALDAEEREAANEMFRGSGIPGDSLVELAPLLASRSSLAEALLGDLESIDPSSQCLAQALLAQSFIAPDGLRSDEMFAIFEELFSLTAPGRTPPSWDALHSELVERQAPLAPRTSYSVVAEPEPGIWALHDVLVPVAAEFSSEPCPVALAPMCDVKTQYETGRRLSQAGLSSSGSHWFAAAVDAAPEVVLWLEEDSLYGAQEADDELHRGALVQLAEAGNSDAMYSLGVVANHEEDRDEAIRWWSKAAELGQPDALVSFGAICFDDGEEDTALEMWRLASADGDSRAVVLLYAAAVIFGDGERSIGLLNELMSSGHERARPAHNSEAPTSDSAPIIVERLLADAGGLGLSSAFMYLADELMHNDGLPGSEWGQGGHRNAGIAAYDYACRAAELGSDEGAALAEWLQDVLFSGGYDIDSMNDGGVEEFKGLDEFLE
ncbi:MAG: hypothetical protein RIE08_09025 [Acidimicrobiales bacterium]